MLTSEIARNWENIHRLGEFIGKTACAVEVEASDIDHGDFPGWFTIKFSDGTNLKIKAIRGAISADSPRLEFDIYTVRPNAQQETPC